MPARKIGVLINPASAGGRAVKAWPEFESLLAAGDFEIVSYTTSSETDFRVHARAFAGRFDIIGICGGDSSLTIAAEELFSAGFDGELVDGLPKGWRRVQLTDLLNTISVTHKFPKGEAIFLNTSDILDGKFLHRNFSSKESLPGQAKKTIQKGDILFTEIRPANRRYAFVDFDADDYVVSTKLMVLRSKGLIDNLVIYYFMKSDEVLHQLQSLAESRSGTFPQITYDELAKVIMPLPDLNTQMCYTDFLWSVFDKVRENEKQIEYLTQTRDTLLPKLMSGQLEVV